MKYIKLYEAFENVEQDIREICYDLTDDGKFEISIRTIDNYPYVTKEVKTCFIHISVSGTYIFGNRGLVDPLGHVSFDVVKDVFLRMKDYLGDRFIDFYYDSFYTKESWKKVKLDENTKNIKSSTFVIKYKLD